MFKSIFSKLMIIFILIIVFSFSTAGVTLYYSLGKFVSEEKVKTLEKAGEEISNYLRIYVENANNPVAEAMFEFLLDSYMKNTSSYIWITNDKGIIVYSSPNMRGLDIEIRSHLNIEQGKYRLPDERQYKKVFSGMDPVIEKGDFFGLYKDTGWSWLVVQKPFKYQDINGKEQVIAAIYLNTPITQINKARATVFRFFIIAVIVAALISIVLVYIFSLRITKPLKQISNAAKVIAGGEFSRRLSIDTEDEIGELAKAFKVKEAGAKILRGGAFKPRTSPYSFHGLEEEGLKILASAREATGMKIATEVVDTRDVELVSYYTDIIQIGARNMQNFKLLQEAGATEKPILLKRGLAATIEEWLMAAEYILSSGNDNIILCERGIRTYETATRNTIDMSAIPVVKEFSHLPILVDPSHATGTWKYVPALSKGAIATGADGLLVEVHSDPTCALCDGPQSLRPSKFLQLMEELKPIALAVGRKI
jgi:3-deoxy-7-phosphoheptulonate synthase